MGEDDPALIEEVGKQKMDLETEIRIDTRGTEKPLGARGIERWMSGDEAGLRQARDKMVDLLNRRNYIRNLVRDVNEVLGS